MSQFAQNEAQAVTYKRELFGIQVGRSRLGGAHAKADGHKRRAVYRARAGLWGRVGSKRTSQRGKRVRGAWRQGRAIEFMLNGAGDEGGHVDPTSKQTQIRHWRTQAQTNRGARPSFPGMAGATGQLGSQGFSAKQVRRVERHQSQRDVR